ncbi:MAG: hypothetical protein MI741_01665 [Rhodospirillales bacterium]|nr:hypothetical protein [Rhodospirillales bacterium]
MNTVLEGAPSRRLVLREDEFSGLKPMLQAGIGIRAKPGRTLRPFLTGDLGFDPAYVEERLQTVLLDGAPVDDFDSATLWPGCTIALSGAMPGLAGATMRRGGYYARMREGIAHRDGGNRNAEANPETLVVYVKLFNRALEDLGRQLIAGRPVLVDRRWLLGLPGREGQEDMVDSRDDGAVWLTVALDG